MNYHPVTQKILKILEDGAYWHETFEHEAVRTSEEAAKIRDGYTLEQGAKAIVLRVKRSKSDKEYVMLVFPAHLRFDNNKVKRLFNAKDIRFVTDDELLKITNGVKPGGVPPFGNLFDLKVVAAKKLFDNEKIVFNAGDRCFSIAIKSADYKEIVNPQISDIT